jgi:hypothetical protein
MRSGPVERAALRSQRGRARRALQQPRADAPFQPLDQLAPDRLPASTTATNTSNSRNRSLAMVLFLQITDGVSLG